MDPRPRTLLVPSLLAVVLAACGDLGNLVGPDPIPTDTIPTDTSPPDTIRIVTFGDSNTDFGYSGTSPTILVSSYVSSHSTRLLFYQPNSTLQLAGKIEQRWSGPDRIVAINHGVGGTSSGTGSNGSGSPNALNSVRGITRFQAEVLGMGYPWVGQEKAGRIVRINAFKPDGQDFAYVSIGTNDPPVRSTAETLANLQAMMNDWVGAGLSPSHLIVTTLPPRSDVSTIPAINAGIRSLASGSGAHLIDLAAYTSDDDGLTWRAADLHVGDSVHYSEPVRNWLAGQVVGHLSTVLYGWSVPADL